MSKLFLSLNRLSPKGQQHQQLTSQHILSSNHWLTLAGSGTLGVIMLQRYLKRGAFMPAGFVTLLSAASLIRQSVITYQIYTEKKTQN